MKSNETLVLEIINHVKEEMQTTMIYELEYHSRLPFTRVMNIVSMAKEILSSDYHVGDSKDGNLLVWERNEEVTQYVIDNLLA